MYKEWARYWVKLFKPAFSPNSVTITVNSNFFHIPITSSHFNQPIINS